MPSFLASSVRGKITFVPCDNFSTHLLARAAVYVYTWHWQTCATVRASGACRLPCPQTTAVIDRGTAIVLDQCILLARQLWLVEICPTDGTFGVVDFLNNVVCNFRDKVAPRRVTLVRQQFPDLPINSGRSSHLKKLCQRVGEVLQAPAEEILLRVQ